MRRGRTKGKKLTMSNQDDLGSGEEEKIPAQKRRGRPLKSLKDEIDEDNDAQKLEDKDSEDTPGILDNAKSKSGSQNGNKRKNNGQVKDNADPVKDETENGTRSSTEESNKFNGFRQSRRKNNTPRRAAGSVVECN